MAFKRKRGYGRKTYKKKRVSNFKKKVRAIARGVVSKTAELKELDTFVAAGYQLSTATVPIGGFVLGYYDMTTGPAQGVGSSNRIGNNIKAMYSRVKWTVANITNLANPSANKAGYLRCSVIELLDQKDEGNILSLPGNAMFENNGVNVDMGSTSVNRMQLFYNKRLYKVHYDRVYRIGCSINADAPKTIYGTYSHKWGGQKWSYDQTGATTTQERRVYMVWYIDSQDQDRTANTTHEIRAELDFSGRLYFTDT